MIKINLPKDITDKEISEIGKCGLYCFMHLSREPYTVISEETPAAALDYVAKSVGCRWHYNARTREINMIRVQNNSNNARIFRWMQKKSGVRPALLEIYK